MGGRPADVGIPQESQEGQINITNFQPFEIDLLLRYIYHPCVTLLLELTTQPTLSIRINPSSVGVDAKVACLQEPTLTYLETCVRLWQLGDYYGIETLAKSAEEQLRERAERYIVEAVHVANMMRGHPFVSEMEGAIRAAWDPEKASGPQRTLLLSLCQAVAPYLRDYPTMIALFDEIPEFASAFIKTVLGYGVISWPSQSRVCQHCRNSISTNDADLRASEVICHSVGTLAAPDGSLGKWYCSRACYQKTEQRFRFKHDHCMICKEGK